MRLVIRVLRRENADAASYWQDIPFETEDENATVAFALSELNKAEHLADTGGEPVAPIRWECSCMQKKCGACAMVVNGRPRLACDTELREFRKKGQVTLEPLRKFPVVADLIVDRSILFENLRIMEAWIRGEGKVREKHSDEAYEAARCLQCGCCLEVCPNFYVGGEFFGTAAFVPTARLLSAMPPKEQEAIREQYKKHVYAGCGKSLACRDVCPAGIDVDRLLSSSNAMAIWKRSGRK